MLEREQVREGDAHPDRDDQGGRAPDPTEHRTIADVIAEQARDPVEPPPIDNRTAMRRALGKPPESLRRVLEALNLTHNEPRHGHMHPDGTLRRSRKDH